MSLRALRKIKWMSSENNGVYNNTALQDYVLSGDVTFTAQYVQQNKTIVNSPSSGTTYYVLSFRTNGGEEIDPVNGIWGEMIDLAKYENFFHTSLVFVIGIFFSSAVFANNKKDLHSMRGFIAKVNHRKDLLSYLKDTDYVLYEKTIKELNIRK